jgi:glycosyltransferase involved in cell wall biosynthesis
MKEKISVIVPVYNVEKYLSRCVDSIINQTYTNLEIILVDDGSTDAGGKMCDEYAQQDNRIIVIHKENGGLSDARNAGLDIATGEYIGFVDSDDFIALEFYEILYKTLIKTNSDLAFCEFQRFHNDTEIIKNHTNYKVRTDKGIDILNNFYNKHYVTYVVMWNKLYKKDIWKNLRFPFGKIHEDEFVIHEIFYLAKQISFINASLYYYFHRENSIMVLKNENMVLRKITNKLEAFDERIKFSERKQLESLCKASVYTRNAMLLNFMFEQRYNESISEKIRNVIKCNYHTFSIKYKIKFFSIKYLPKIYFFYIKCEKNFHILCKKMKFFLKKCIIIRLVLLFQFTMWNSIYINV